jgi:hypothetical protein
VDGEALATLVVNKGPGSLKCRRHQSPQFWGTSQGGFTRYCHPHRRSSDFRRSGLKSWHR